MEGSGNVLLCILIATQVWSELVPPFCIFHNYVSFSNLDFPLWKTFSFYSLISQFIFTQLLIILFHDFIFNLGSLTPLIWCKPTMVDDISNFFIKEISGELGSTKSYGSLKTKKTFKKDTYVLLTNAFSHR